MEKKRITTNDTQPRAFGENRKSARLTSNKIQPKKYADSGVIVKGAPPYIDTANVDELTKKKKKRKKRSMKTEKLTGEKSRG